MGKYSLRDRLRIAQEENEQNVESDVQTDGSGTVQVTDAVQAESDAAEIADMQTQVQQDQEALEEAQEVAEAVEQQIEANDEKLENPAEVTPADVQASQEALKDAMTAYGESLATIRSVNMSYESIEASPARALELSQEGLKDFFSKLWEGLKSMFNKIVEFFKKLWTKIKGFFGNLESKCQALIDKCNSASDDATTKDIDGDTQKKVVQNIGGVMFIAGGNSMDKIVNDVLKFDNMKKVLQAIGNDSNTMATAGKAVLAKVTAAITTIAKSTTAAATGSTNPTAYDRQAAFQPLRDAAKKFQTSVNAYTATYSAKLFQNAGIQNNGSQVIYSMSGNKIKVVTIIIDLVAETASKTFKAESVDLTTIPDPSGLNNFNKDSLKKLVESVKSTCAAIKVYDPQQTMDVIKKNMESSANEFVKETNKLEDPKNGSKEAIEDTKLGAKGLRAFYSFASKSMNDIYTDYYNNVKGLISGLSVLVGALAKEKDD